MDKEKVGPVSFKYIFPNDLKELHINGAYGGIGPDGTIRMAVYSERGAIPNMEKRTFSPDGTLGDVIEIEKKYNVVRVIQASLVLNMGTAKSLIKWLEDRIKDYESFRGQIAKGKESE